MMKKFTRRIVGSLPLASALLSSCLLPPDRDSTLLVNGGPVDSAVLDLDTGTRPGAPREPRSDGSQGLPDANGGAPFGGTTGGEPFGGDPFGGYPFGGAQVVAPADPELSANWSAAGLELVLHTSAENGPYKFGLAETGNGENGWYGEDCVPGEKNGLDACHPIPAEGMLMLRDVATIPEVAEGTDSLLGEAEKDGVTFVVIRSTDENQGCWTWGHNPQYYKDALGCNDATLYVAPPPAGGAAAGGGM